MVICPNKPGVPRYRWNPSGSRFLSLNNWEHCNMCCHANLCHSYSKIRDCSIKHRNTSRRIMLKCKHLEEEMWVVQNWENDMRLAAFVGKIISVSNCWTSTFCGLPQFLEMYGSNPSEYKKSLLDQAVIHLVQEHVSQRSQPAVLKGQ